MDKREATKDDVKRYIRAMEREARTRKLDGIYREMDSKYRTLVMDWVRLNFEPGEVDVKDFPGVLPGAVTLTDKEGGQLLAWWDIMSERVEYKIRGEE